MLLLLLLSRSVVSNCVRPRRRQRTRLCRPSDSPGKNTGMGCHFLLQCMKVKSESEVAQSCPTLSNPMDCSLPGSSVHGIFQARVLEWGAKRVEKHHHIYGYSYKYVLKITYRDFPVGPAVKTRCSQCKNPSLDSWWRN